MSAFYVGEGLVIEGSDLDNVAHIDLMIGPKDGPVGVAFAGALANQSAGHTNLLAVVSPNIVCKPSTVMITKVTLKGGKQVMQMFGPAQAAVACAVVDSVVDGTLPKDKAEDWVIVCGVFIAPSAQRQQEDLQEQLRSHETRHQERDEENAQHRRNHRQERYQAPVRVMSSCVVSHWSLSRVPRVLAVTDSTRTSD